MGTLRYSCNYSYANLLDLHADLNIHQKTSHLLVSWLCSSKRYIEICFWDILQTNHSNNLPFTWMKKKENKNKQLCVWTQRFGLGLKIPCNHSQPRMSFRLYLGRPWSTVGPCLANLHTISVFQVLSPWIHGKALPLFLRACLSTCPCVWAGEQERRQQHSRLVTVLLSCAWEHVFTLWLCEPATGSVL